MLQKLTLVMLVASGFASPLYALDLLDKSQPPMRQVAKEEEVTTPAQSQQEKNIEPVPVHSDYDLQVDLPCRQAQLANFEMLLEQNMGGIIQNDPGMAYRWSNYFTPSARLDVDAGGSNVTPNTLPRAFGGSGRYTHLGSDDIVLSNAFLYLDGRLPSWATAHVSLFYNTYNGKYQLFDQDNGLVARPIYTNGTLTSINRDFTRDRATADEAFVRINNFDRFPVYAEAGRFYVPFGNYQLHPIVETLTQRLTQLQGDGGEIGAVIPVGQTGGVSIVGYGVSPSQEPARFIHESSGNWGAQVAYTRGTAAYGYTFDLGYLYNMLGVDFLSTTPVGIVGAVGNFKTVSGIALDALGHVGPFDGHVDFASALSKFNPLDEPFTKVATVQGATPKAVVAGSGYSFLTFGHASRLGIDFQHSWQAAQLGLGAVLPGAGLPRNRVETDYIYTIVSHATIQIQLRYDEDYSRRYGGTGRNGVAGMVRFTVGFA